jgi:hypothetical protein
LIVVAVVSLFGAAALTAQEPVSAPPALPDGVLEASRPLTAELPEASEAGPQIPPAPADFEPREESEIVTAGRRMNNPLAPAMIGGGSDSFSNGMIISEGTGGMTFPVTTMMDAGEGAVRISDKSGEELGAAPPGPKASHMIAPHARYCPHGVPYHECPECDPPRRLVNQYRRRHGLVLPPDYGWSPPGRHPIDRISIDYYRAFPAAYNGQPVGPAVVRPSVYWPTDTTQLGYTYQHSPRWLPYPGMVPPVPHPGQWHHPLCYGPNGYSGAYGQCPHCPPGAHGAAPLDHDHEEIIDEEPLPPQTATLPQGPDLNRATDNPSLVPVPF